MLLDKIITSTGVQISKVEKYNWSKDLGEPGKLLWLDKNLITVDKKYQREASVGRVLDIARAFTWKAFVVVPVAHRGGKYYAMDCQHRVLAAQRRDDITKIPCIVFTDTSVAEEAETFNTINNSRKGVSAADKFKASIVAKDPVAIRVHNEIVKPSGRLVATNASPTTISCIRALLVLEEGCSPALRRVWPLVTEICAGAVLHERILQALVYIEHHLEGGISLTDSKWKKRLTNLGYTSLLTGIATMCAAYAKGGPKVYARGVLNLINKGLMEANYLRMRGDLEEE
jgi:hypothetical protein